MGSDNARFHVKIANYELNGYMSVVDISTSQNVSINFSVASIAERLIATFIDFVIQGVYILLMVLLLFGGFSALGSITSIGGSTLVVSICFIALPVLTYHLWTEFFFKGRSIGKMAMSLQVVMLDGTEPGFLNFFSRWILRLLDITLFSGLIAIVVLIASSKGQRIGDLAAGTTVIRKKRKGFTAPSAKDFEQDENYESSFPQVLNLSDKDLELIREVLSRGIGGQNDALIEATADKVKNLLQVDTEMSDILFLKAVVKDYNYLVGNL